MSVPHLLQRPNKKRKLRSRSSSPPSSTSAPSTARPSLSLSHASAPSMTNRAVQTSPVLEHVLQSALITLSMGPPAVPVDATGHMNPQSHSNANPPVAPPAPVPTPIPSIVFYNLQPHEWIKDRVEAGFSPKAYFLMQLLASIMYAKMERREAAHYATWTLAAGQNLTDVEILDKRMKVAVSTICPQLPLAAEEDITYVPDNDESDELDDEGIDIEKKMDDMIDAELSDSGEMAQDEASNVEGRFRGGTSDDNGTHGPRSTPPDDNSSSERPTQQPEQSEKKKEIEYRYGSVRIPDFVQVSHIFDLSQALQDVFTLFRQLHYDVSDFLKEAENQLPHLRSQVTLLVEIKLDGDYSEFQISQFNDQLDAQARHFFASGAKEDAIGGILALGHRYTYREITRQYLRRFAKLSTRPFDDQDYGPDSPTVNVHRNAQKRTKFSTWRQEMLFTHFMDGNRFIDVQSDEGRNYLQQINYRAQELFPTFWGHHPDLNLRLRPSPFD